MNHDARYNGWTNFTTWAVFTWLDEPDWIDPEFDPIGYSGSVQAVADRLREAVTSSIPCDNPGIWYDLASHALDSVNWTEIAEHLVDGACLYCGAQSPAMHEVPPAQDDISWRELARHHEPDCEWVRTRAHRRDA